MCPCVASRTGAAASASVTASVGTTGRTLRLRFGAQTDTKVIRSGTSSAVTPVAVANYIAKYVTKDGDIKGLPSYRIRSALELRSLRCAPHYRTLIETAWTLGYKKWAHCLGHGGHPLTKSRRFSTTFGQHRTARKEHRHAARHPDGEPDPWGRIIDETTVLFLGDWH